jgi:hypothetical protein
MEGYAAHANTESDRDPAGIDGTMKVLIVGRGLGKASIVVGDKARQKRICRLDRADASLSSFARRSCSV